MHVGCVDECHLGRKRMERITDEALWKKYPLRMGRYLTQEEREDIRRLCPPTEPDWSNWKKKLENGAVSAAARKANANEGGD
jgi:hypothetical protein